MTMMTGPAEAVTPVVADLAEDLHDGIQLAAESIDSGRALEKLHVLVTESN